MQNAIKLKLLNTNFKKWDNSGQTVKNMIPISDLFIWEQAPKTGDCPPKIVMFGQLILQSAAKLFEHLG